MKKILALILAALLIFCMAACSKGKEEESNEEEKKEEKLNVVSDKTGTFEYATNSEGDYEIIGFTPASLDAIDLVLPKETEDGRDIVGIGANAFKTKLTLKSVTLPDIYTYIDNYAFYGCDNLEKVVMVDAVTSIGNGAFQNCPKLSDITLSKNIKNVGKDAFRGCVAIKSLDFSAAEVIGQGAFYGCSTLEEISISDKITYISAYAFTNTPALKYADDSKGGKYLGNAENPYVALVAPSSLNIESCVVNNNTKLIAEWAFAYCADLTKVELGKSITVINGTCFDNNPEFDKSFGENDIPQVELDFNVYEFGCYLGTATNPYMVLVDIIATNDDGFKLHKDTKIITDTAFEGSKIRDIGFDGTQEQWDAIIKTENWTHDKIIDILLTPPAAEAN